MYSASTYERLKLKQDEPGMCVHFWRLVRKRVPVSLLLPLRVVLVGHSRVLCQVMLEPEVLSKPSHAHRSTGVHLLE
jgi:hypothetical protein